MYTQNALKSWGGGHLMSNKWHFLFHSACLYFQHFRSEFVTDIQINIVLQCEAVSQKRCCLGYEWADICVYVTVPQTHGCHFSDSASAGKMQKLITFQKKCEECVLLRDHFHCLFMQECYFYNFRSPSSSSLLTAHPSKSRRERRERWALLQ